jgi:MFS family permease
MSSSQVTRFRLVAWCVALFVSCLFLHTRHNGFPWYYHPDEPGKVEQVLGMRPFNFHHPMLLLASTKVGVAVASASSEQRVVEIGRTVSALFTAISVVALTLLAFRWRGWPAAISGGLALLFHHQLFELAHYMKEDTALLLGVAVTFAAAFRYEREPGLGTAVGIGLGIGLAIAGKYLGFVALFIGIPVLFRHRLQGAFTAAFVTAGIIFIAFNFPMLADWATLSKSFAKETKLVIEGQGQVTQSVPHSRYWSVFLANTTPVIWILLLAVLYSAARRRQELTLMEWTLIGFPFLYALALSFSPKENDRYFLPATAIFTLLAAAGTVEFPRLFSRRPSRTTLEIALGAALVFAQFPSWTEDRAGLWRYNRAFQRDDTAELVEWLRTNVPPPAVIAKDEKVRLPTLLRKAEGPGAQPLPNEVLSEDYVADLGSIEQLRSRGVTHIVITPTTYQRFERAGLRPTSAAAGDFERRKSFYAALRRDYDPVKLWPRSTVIYLHPGLEVYDIRPEK